MRRPPNAPPGLRKNRTPRSFVRVSAFALGLSLSAAAPFSSHAHADQVASLSETLIKSPVSRERVVAAVGLGRVSDPRTVEPFLHALDDTDSTVRGVAAAALGSLGDSRAIQPLTRALGDPSPFVRRRAQESLSRLKTAFKTPESPALAAPKVAPRAFVAVKSAANQSSTGGTLMAAKLRQLLESALQGTADLGLGSDPSKRINSVTVDSSIVGFSKKTSRLFVEITCDVRLIVGSADGHVLTLVNGAATVQAPRRGFTQSAEHSATMDALGGAVRGAHENLVSYLLKR